MTVYMCIHNAYYNYLVSLHIKYTIAGYTNCMILEKLKSINLLFNVNNISIFLNIEK